jgi:carboxyl-terminal processing protease
MGVWVRRARAWMTIGAIALAGCETISSDPIALPPADGLAKGASEYLEGVLDLMQTNSINRRKIGWDQFRLSVRQKAGKAATSAETHEAIRFAVSQLNDSHGAFFAPGSGGSGNPAPNFPVVMATGVSIGPTAYIRMPSFSGGTADARRYADSLQLLIRTLDDAQPCGWIVDLRSDEGTNMYPMIAGLGPVIGEDILGYFVDPDDRRSSWFHAGGVAGVVDARGTVFVVHKVSNTPYTLRSPSAPVAVLAGPSTTGSGEALLISFRGRPNTRSFGARTSGFSTATSQFNLSDGATLVLTTTTMADRGGQVFGGVLNVDEPVAGASGVASSTDLGTQRASAWLRSLNECSGR